MKGENTSELVHQCSTKHSLATRLTLSENMPSLHASLFMQKIQINSASLLPHFSHCVSPLSQPTTLHV